MATFLAISRTNAIHALLYFIVSLLALALVFFLLGAPFAAALEVIIYAGAIMVLFVFVIMMLNLGAEAAKQEREWLRPSGWIGPAMLAAILLGEFICILAGKGLPLAEAGMVGPKAVGAALFGLYVVGVELASLLLLAGLVGAYYLGRRDEAQKKGGAIP